MRLVQHESDWKTRHLHHGVWNSLESRQPSGSAPSWLQGSQGFAASNKGLNVLAVQGAFLAHVKRYAVFALKPGFWHSAQYLSGPPGARMPRTDRFEEHRLSTRLI